MRPPVIVSFGAGLNSESHAGVSTRARAEAAALLHERHPGSVLLFCGKGTVPGHSEAEAMRAVALERGVAAETIRIEPDSVDTAESVQNAVALLPSEALRGRPVLLVTGRRHLARAAGYFLASGVPVEALATDAVLGRAVDVPDAGPRTALTGAILRALALVDRKGSLVTRLARLLRRP